MGPSKFVIGKRICFQSFFSRKREKEMSWEHFTFQGTIFQCYIIPHNKAQTFSWTNKTKKSFWVFFFFQFYYFAWRSALKFLGYCVSLDTQGPRGLLGPRGSPGTAGQRVSTTPPSLLIRRFPSLKRSSLISNVCRASLELMGKLVLKETWWDFFLLKLCSFLVGETVKFRPAGRSLKN